MGRRSVREDKSVWQLAREKRGLTREQAGDLIPGLTAERIEKLESGRAAVQPEDVLLMAQGYRAPELCRLYCARTCPLGRDGRVP